MSSVRHSNQTLFKFKLTFFILMSHLFASCFYSANSPNTYGNGSPGDGGTTSTSGSQDGMNSFDIIGCLELGEDTADNFEGAPEARIEGSIYGILSAPAANASDVELAAIAQGGQLIESFASSVIVIPNPRPNPPQDCQYIYRFHKLIADNHGFEDMIAAFSVRVVGMEANGAMRALAEIYRDYLVLHWDSNEGLKCAHDGPSYFNGNGGNEFSGLMVSIFNPSSLAPLVTAQGTVPRAPVGGMTIAEFESDGDNAAEINRIAPECVESAAFMQDRELKSDNDLMNQVDELHNIEMINQ